MNQPDQKSFATLMDLPLQVAIPVSKVLPYAILGSLAPGSGILLCRRGTGCDSSHQRHEHP